MPSDILTRVRPHARAGAPPLKRGIPARRGFPRSRSGTIRRQPCPSGSSVSASFSPHRQRLLSPRRPPSLCRRQVVSPLQNGDPADLERCPLRRETDLDRQARLLLHLDVVRERDANGEFTPRSHLAGRAARLGELSHIRGELFVPREGLVLTHQLGQPAQHRVGSAGSGGAGDHDLPVDHAAWWQAARDRSDQLGEVPGHRPFVAAADLHLVAVAEHDRAEAVPLRFVPHAVRYLGDRSGQHRRHRGQHGKPERHHAPSRAGGGGGQRQDRRSEPVLQTLQPSVRRPEVVSPLADAVGLVDDEERDGAPMHELAQVPVQGLGREVHELVPTRPQRREPGLALPPPQRRVDLGRPESEVRERVDLILHEADQRRDDEHGPVEDPRRQLVGERLARTRRHDRGAVPTPEDGVDDLALPRAEALEAEDVSEDLLRIGVGRWSGAVGSRGGPPAPRGWRG